MTSQKMHDFFDIIQDKYGSPYFTDIEKDLILNRAQVALVESFLPLDINAPTLEETSIIFSKLEPLVYELSSLTTTSGDITKSTIQTALNSASSTTEPPLVYLNVSFGGNPCKFVRHNDIYKFQKNEFKAGSLDSPQYKILHDKLSFLPSTSGTAVTITLLKRPEDILVGVTDSELPDSLHNKIVAIGLEFAGIASRDEALVSIANIQK